MILKLNQMRIYDKKGLDFNSNIILNKWKFKLNQII